LRDRSLAEPGPDTANFSLCELGVLSEAGGLKISLNREGAKNAKGYVIFVDWVYNQQNILQNKRIYSWRTWRLERNGRFKK
jgi:hypothetical protein